MSNILMSSNDNDTMIMMMMMIDDDHVDRVMQHGELTLQALHLSDGDDDVDDVDDLDDDGDDGDDDDDDLDDDVDLDDDDDDDDDDDHVDRVVQHGWLSLPALHLPLQVRGGGVLGLHRQGQRHGPALVRHRGEVISVKS